jgi:hypothetical protein
VLVNTTTANSSRKTRVTSSVRLVMYREYTPRRPSGRTRFYGRFVGRLIRPVNDCDVTVGWHNCAMPRHLCHSNSRCKGKTVEIYLTRKPRPVKNMCNINIFMAIMGFLYS